MAPTSETVPWLEDGVQCIVLCAGAGTRMNPRGGSVPKVLVEMHGRPILDHVLSFWRRFTDRFILVVGQQREMMYDYIRDRGLECETVVQEELRGIAHAVGLCEDRIEGRFILQLGDCLTSGALQWPPAMEVGVGVWPTTQEADILQSYSVRIEENRIAEVVEKPKQAPNNLCGMGTYFLDRRVFDTIRRTSPSPLRGELEITDVLANLIAEGRLLRPVFLTGNYLNVTFPEDISRAENLFPPLPG